MSFSKATFSACFAQKKRQMNALIRVELATLTGLNRTAFKLNLNRKTVARRLEFLGELAKKNQRRRIAEQVRTRGRITRIQFDEMETFQHSRLLPVSIGLVVSLERKILGYSVCTMPAKGLLAERSRKKYGPRKDERPETLERLLGELQPFLAPDVVAQSDSNPYYPQVFKSIFPEGAHKRSKGRKPVIAGQGELKEGARDPLFAVNHTAAMIRANVNRLIRRTWCSTKKLSSLENHLAIYADYHNEELTPAW